MVQTVFDSESFSFVQKAVECSGDCMGFDFMHSTAHRHCENTMGSAPCNAFVYIQQEGPSSSEIAVLREDGCICAECGLVACIDCTTTHPMTEKRICLNCYEEIRKDAQAGDEIFDSLDRVAESLKSYLACIQRENNPVKLRETILGLHKVEDLLADINRLIIPNIERAYGMQQVLPSGVA